jgi:hypothetical protein
MAAPPGCRCLQLRRGGDELRKVSDNGERCKHQLHHLFFLSFFYFFYFFFYFVK